MINILGAHYSLQRLKNRFFQKQFNNLAFAYPNSIPQFSQRKASQQIQVLHSKGMSSEEYKALLADHKANVVSDKEPETKTDIKEGIFARETFIQESENKLEEETNPVLK